MENRDWSDKADALEVTHKGTPVWSHPNVISQQETQWKKKKQEEEKGKQAHNAINYLFASLEIEEEFE